MGTVTIVNNRLEKYLKEAEKLAEMGIDGFGNLYRDLDGGDRREGGKTGVIPAHVKAWENDKHASDLKKGSTRKEYWEAVSAAAIGTNTARIQQAYSNSDERNEEALSQLILIYARLRMEGYSHPDITR